MKETKRERHLLDLPGKRLYGQDIFISRLPFSSTGLLPSALRNSDSLTIHAIIDETLSYPVTALTLQDYNFIMHWHRIFSFPGHPMPVTWDCPKCGHLDNVTRYGKDALVFTDVHKDYKDGMNLELSTGKYKLRLERVGDEEAGIEDAKLMNKVSPRDLFICKIAQQFVMRQKIQDKYNILKNLNGDDAVRIAKWEQKWDYGIQDGAQFTCIKCEEKSGVVVNITPDCFLPDVIARNAA